MSSLCFFGCFLWFKIISHLIGIDCCLITFVIYFYIFLLLLIVSLPQFLSFFLFSYYYSLCYSFWYSLCYSLIFSQFHSYFLSLSLIDSILMLLLYFVSHYFSYWNNSDYSLFRSFSLNYLYDSSLFVMICFYHNNNMSYSLILLYFTLLLYFSLDSDFRFFVFLVIFYDFSFFLIKLLLSSV